MVRPSVQPGQSGNFRVELKTRSFTAKATMAGYYNVICRRALMFKRLVVLRGTVPCLLDKRHKNARQRAIRLEQYCFTAMKLIHAVHTRRPDDKTREFATCLRWRLKRDLPVKEVLQIVTGC